jgi:hypothetical protein
MEQRFEAVGYFACSPLGRPVDLHRGDAFQGYGLLDPLVYLLAGDVE